MEMTNQRAAIGEEEEKTEIKRTNRSTVQQGGERNRMDQSEANLICW